VNAQDQLKKRVALLAAMDTHAKSCDWLSHQITIVAKAIEETGDCLENRRELLHLVSRYNIEVRIHSELEEKFNEVNLPL